MKIPRFARLGFACALLVSFASAQHNDRLAESNSASPAADSRGTESGSSARRAASKRVALALKSREDAVVAIAAGKETPQEVMTRMRSGGVSAGLLVEASADFGLAAIDIGQRLVVHGKVESAESFFTEAEKSLSQAIDDTADKRAQEKALYLRKRSFIRGKYLNKGVQALEDIERAIALQPEDQTLKRAKQLIINSRLPIAVEKPKG